MKLCSKCKLTQEDREFYPNPRTATGLASYCRSCVASTKKQWAANHPEAVRGHRKKWKAENLDHWNRLAAKSQMKRKVAIRAYGKKYQQEQREKLSDTYIAQKLRMPRAAIPPTLIDLKRVSLAITRELKKGTK